MMTSSTCIVEHYVDRLERWTRARLPAHARGRTTVQALVREAIVNAACEARSAGCTVSTHAALLMHIRARLQRHITETFPSDQQPAIEPFVFAAAAHSPSPSPLAPPPSLAAELIHRYEESLNRLSDADRQAIVLRLELGFPWMDVCELLSKRTPAAAQMTVSRALVRLAQEIAE